MLLILTLFGAIGLACSAQTRDPTDLPTTKALRCVVGCLNNTQGKGQTKSTCHDDIGFVNCLPLCEGKAPGFSFVEWFLEKRPHDNWVIPLATTTSSTSSSASTPTTTTTIKLKNKPPNAKRTAPTTTTTLPTTPATTSRPRIYGAKRILKKYCDVFGNPKGTSELPSGTLGTFFDLEANKFYDTFNDIWTDIQEALDNDVGHGWNPAHNEKEFCKLYNDKFLKRAKKIALDGLNERGTTKPSTNDLANDVMDYLDRSVRLAYFVGHFVHFGNKPIPDTCRRGWFPKSIMNS